MLDLKDEWLGLSDVPASAEVYDSIYDDISEYLSPEKINELNDEDIHKLCVLFCIFPVDFSARIYEVIDSDIRVKEHFQNQLYYWEWHKRHGWKLMNMSKSKQNDHKQLVFVTHNKGKIESANKYFDGKVCFKALDCEVPEIRGTLEEIAIAKVKSAYDITNKPTIAMDAGFVIEALNGYPGPYVNYTLSTIGIDGILKLMKGGITRECRFVQCLAYYDGVGEPKIFHGIHEGAMAPEKRGVLSNDDWSELSLIFVPKEELAIGQRTLAELSHEERVVLAKENDDCSAFARFRDWYLENYAIT